MTTGLMIGLAVALIFGVVIVAGFALDDPGVLDAIEREGAAARRAADWAIEAVYIGAAWLTETYARVRYAYRRREGRHYAPGARHEWPWSAWASRAPRPAGRHHAYA